MFRLDKTPEELERKKLRELALRTESKEWCPHHCETVILEGTLFDCEMHKDNCIHINVEDNKYIAAANPAAILRLLDYIDKLETDIRNENEW